MLITSRIEASRVESRSAELRRGGDDDGRKLAGLPVDSEDLRDEREREREWAYELGLLYVLNGPKN